MCSSDLWKLIHEHLADWEVIIVGDGDERMNLQKQTEELQLPRVRFVGFSNDIASFYREASILCLVSSFEGWPLCLTEAQANGVVPVAFDCSAGVHQILAPSWQNGVLIKPYRISDFADALVKLSEDGKLLEQMRRQVVQKASEYSIEQVGPQWLALLNEL